ncbi:hypothetical protein HMPREF3230_00607 [Gardnerella vaginalis]|uniref:Uncharacterized protein n=1 Tax=Gardnerella vaginalis TaxID=2702 RepID=A0A135Z7S6_GARVA|nr:hypothetical protein HMPREF3230_00607 [Gardnerella vaginalis]
MQRTQNTIYIIAKDLPTKQTFKTRVQNARMKYVYTNARNSRTTAISTKN